MLIWHVIFINFVGDKTCELYVLNKYFKVIILIWKTTYMFWKEYFIG